MKTSAGRSLKILHVVHSLEPGGMENGVVNLARGLQSRGFETHVSCLERRGVFAENLPARELVEVLQKTGGFSWRAVLGLARHIARVRPDVVHSHNLGPLIYSSSATAFGTRATLVHGEHSQLTADELTARRLRQRRWTYRACRRIHTVSDGIREQLEALQFPAGKILAIPNGVDTSRFKPAPRGEARSRLGLPADALFIGISGRFGPFKRHEILLEAFDQIAPVFPSARLLVIGGGGPKEAAIRDQAMRSSARDRLHLVGFQHDPVPFYQALDLLAIPSSNEGLSNAALEAMACGVTVLANVGCGHEQIVASGEDGMIADLGSPAALAQALTALLAEPGRLAKFGGAARLKVENHFSLTAMVDAYERLYREAVAPRATKMDFVSIILFLVMYYIRPQEWGALFSTLHFVQIVMLMSVVTLFFRERSVRFGDLLKTPHDWVMLAFFAWIVLASPTHWETFKNVVPLAVFYIVIVQTLVSAARIRKFVGWWAVLIVVLAALAIAGEFGFDPLASSDITNGPMKGRLVLNLSIFKNPNALGHNVVPAIPMLYFLFVWKRPIFLKEVGVALILIPLWCIYLTLSKGAFLCCAVTLLATQTFGRPKAVQAIIIAGAVLFGGAVLWKLPRMTELDKAKGDAAIQGRVAAFTHGLSRLETHTFGVGYAQWLKDFNSVHHYRKAAHSSYVQIGAELGEPGFFLFFGILFCNLRTLVTAKTSSVDDERIRRCLFVLVVSYMCSSWMVDFGYRPTFFMFSAAIAAFHRHLRGLSEPEIEVEPVEVPITWPAWRGQFLPQPQYAGVLAKSTGSSVVALEPIPAVQVATRIPHPAGEVHEEAMPWNRIGWLDVLVTGLMTFAAIKFWATILHRM